MSEENQAWWANPQGILAACTIATLILGFFYVRERQMWDNSTRILAVETRGDKAIEEAYKRSERMERITNENQDRINSLERKIDHLEYDVKELKDDKDKQYQKPYQ